MSPSLKAFLALVFVVATGAVLIQPILDAVDAPLSVEQEPRSKKSPRPGPSPVPSPKPAPTPTTQPGGSIAGRFRTQPLFDRYPASCLRPPTPDDRTALIAVVERGRISFGTTAGPTDPGPPGGTTLGKVKALLGFDLTGHLYAAASTSGGVVFSPPEGLQGADGKLPFGRIDALAWSPTSTCSVAIGERGSLFVLPSKGPVHLVPEGVLQASYSPDGRRLALVLEEGNTISLWVADLGGTTMREIHRWRSGPRLSLEGWTPDGRTLFFTDGPDRELSFVTASDPPLSGGFGQEVSGLEQCSDRVLGIVNGAIAEISNRGPEYLTQTDAGYSAVSCSQNGSFLAAIRDDDLFLLDGAGRELRDLTLDSGFRDIYVDWGGPGAGLLFGRWPTGGGEAQVWHLAEGGAARNTGLTFTPGPGAIDWSASPPSGLVHC